MLYEKDSNKIPKKTAQKLAKFSYYIDSLFPDASSQLTLHNTSQTDCLNNYMNQVHEKITSRGMSYSYCCSRIENLAAVNSESILGSVKKLYLSRDVIKISEMSYHKEGVFTNKTGYMGGKGWWGEIVDFVLIQNKENHQKSQSNTNNTTSNEKAKLAYTTNSTPKPSNISDTKPNDLSTATTKPKEYWLYVIHNASVDSSLSSSHEGMQRISWQHFVERYHFVTGSGRKGNGVGDKREGTTMMTMVGQVSDSVITYEMLYSYKPEQQRQSYFSSEASLMRGFITWHCRVNKPGQSTHLLQKLQGYLLQRSSQVQSSQAKQTDPAFSDQHRRQTKIPIEYFKPYLRLKHDIYCIYMQLYSLQSQQDINKYFYENLICRYLIAKQYQFDQAKKCIIQYLNWQKQLTQKYPSIQCFSQYHSLGAYQCIGQDFMCRPVLLSKSALIDVNKLPDIQKYCDYYIYYLEIYLRTKMRGYVDQMMVIGDLEDLGTRNFKLAVTKRNLGDSLKYGPERQHCLVVVNASTFAYTVWTFIKPLLPKKTLHKIQISGHNKKDIIEALSAKMDIKVIPEYLGGQNTNVDKEFQNKGEKAPLLSMKHQQQIEFAHGKDLHTPKLQKMQRSKNNDEQYLQKVQLVTTSSGLTEAQKADNNALFSLFQSVTKSLGLSFQ